MDAIKIIADAIRAEQAAKAKEIQEQATASIAETVAAVTGNNDEESAGEPEKPTEDPEPTEPEDPNNPET